MVLLERSMVIGRPAFQVVPLSRSSRVTRLPALLRSISGSDQAIPRVNASLLDVSPIAWTSRWPWPCERRASFGLWASNSGKPGVNNSRAKRKAKTPTTQDAVRRESPEAVPGSVGRSSATAVKEGEAEMDATLAEESDIQGAVSKRDRVRSRKSSAMKKSRQRRRARKGGEQVAADGEAEGSDEGVGDVAESDAEIEDENAAEDEDLLASELIDQGVAREEEEGGAGEGIGDDVTVVEQSANARAAAVTAGKPIGRKSSPESRVYENPVPAADVDPAVAATEKRIRELSFTGRCQEAMDLLASIRENGRRPSMAASVDVMGVCRRALRLEEAEELYSEMIAEHFPDHLFREYAAAAPEDESKRLVERAFSIALMMEEEPYEAKDEETYRGLLLCSREDGCWQVAVLLCEQAQRDGVRLGVYSVDMLCSLLMGAGHEDVSAMMYEKYILGRGDEVSEEVWNVGRVGPQVVELHNLTSSCALATVRLLLTDLVTEPSSRAVLNKDRAIKIITGMGHNSEGGEAVIKGIRQAIRMACLQKVLLCDGGAFIFQPQVMSLLDRMGIEHGFKDYNEGCIVIEPYAIRDFTERIADGRGAAVPGAHLACSSLGNAEQRELEPDGGRSDVDR